MDTVKCTTCENDIEYTHIINDTYLLNGESTGMIDLVSRDNLCPDCEKVYYGED